jgi:hypothetical protein
MSQHDETSSEARVARGGSPLTDEQALRVMNAWRRLTALMVLVDSPSMPRDVVETVREFVEPAIGDLGTLADQIPSEQLNATLDTPAAWFPDLRQERWRRVKNER